VKLFKIPLIKKRKSDEDLIVGFKKTGDLEMLGELYSGYMHLVYGVCLKYLKNRDESMDGVMQIFEKLIIEIPKHNIENFRSWLHVVTKNYCLMKLRTERTEMNRVVEWLNDPTSFMEYETPLHPIDDDRDEDMEMKLSDCIERLREEQKKCITGFYFNNMCYGEIALDLGIDEKKVKSHLQNGKRNLKLCLEGKNEREG
jgi:RNA polymerase sigma-70 factor (ECF subfamily)